MGVAFFFVFCFVNLSSVQRGWAELGWVSCAALSILHFLCADVCIIISHGWRRRVEASLQVAIIAQ